MVIALKRYQPCFLSNEQDPCRHFLAVLDVIITKELDEQLLLDYRSHGHLRNASTGQLTPDPTGKEMIQHCGEDWRADWIAEHDLWGMTDTINMHSAGGSFRLAERLQHTCVPSAHHTKPAYEG